MLCLISFALSWLGYLTIATRGFGTWIWSTVTIDRIGKSSGPSLNSRCIPCRDTPTNTHTQTRSCSCAFRLQTKKYMCMFFLPDHVFVTPASISLKRTTNVMLKRKNQQVVLLTVRFFFIFLPRAFLLHKAQNNKSLCTRCIQRATMPPFKQPRGSNIHTQN